MPVGEKLSAPGYSRAGLELQADGQLILAHAVGDAIALRALSGDAWSQLGSDLRVHSGSEIHQLDLVLSEGLPPFIAWTQPVGRVGIGPLPVQPGTPMLLAAEFTAQ